MRDPRLCRGVDAISKGLLLEVDSVDDLRECQSPLRDSWKHPGGSKERRNHNIPNPAEVCGLAGGSWCFDLQSRSMSIVCNTVANAVFA